MEAESRPVCVIYVIGDANVGKSTLIEKWSHSDVHNELERMIDIVPHEWRCTDSRQPVDGGQTNWFFHGYFLVYDTTVKESLDNVLHCAKTIFELARKNRRISLPVMFLVANKDDLDAQQFFALGDEEDMEKQMQDVGISRWENTCAVESRNTEFSFARLIFHMLGPDLLEKMVAKACFQDHLDLVKILFLQLNEGDYAFYAGQAFRGASKRHLEIPVATPLKRKLENLPRRKDGLSTSPTWSLTPAPLGLFWSESGEDETGNTGTDVFSGSMEVLTYLLSLNARGVMKTIISEASSDPVLFGLLLRQYFPQCSNGTLKWKRFGLTVLMSSWLASCRNLTEVHLSHNQLKTVPLELFQVPTVKTINLSDNQLCALPPAAEWQSDSLSRLDLSENLLKGDEGGSLHPTVDVAVSVFPGGSKSQRKSSTPLGHLRTASVGRKSSGKRSVGPYLSRLFTVVLNGNPLAKLPDWVLGLPGLAVLDIRNTSLTRLPKELANCRDLLNLQLDKDRFCYPSTKILESGVAGIRKYLYSQLYRTVPYYEMGLLVLGNSGVGKSLLIRHLQNQSKSILSRSKAPPAADGQTFYDFCLKPKDAQHEITFHVVDFDGREIFQNVSQCFLSERAVYFAVWNAIDGQKGLLALRPWLFSIKASAPRAQVVLVATHCDDSSQHDINNLEDMVQSVYPYKDGKALFHEKGLPNIVDSRYVGLQSPDSLKNMHELRALLFTTAMQVRNFATGGRAERYLKQQVPRDYTILQKVVVAKAKDFRAKKLPGMMKLNELWQLARKENCQIDDIDDFLKACKFLHEAGVLLHFANSRGDLSDYVFIDLQWLYDIIARVIQVDASAMDGTSRKRQKGVLLCRWLPAIIGHLVPESSFILILGVLENFHIIVALNCERSKFLVPALFPAIAPRSGSFGFKHFAQQQSLGDADEGNISLPLSEALLRQYQLPYVPTSFWSKLISSLVVLFTEQKGSAAVPSSSYGTRRKQAANKSFQAKPTDQDEVDGRSSAASKVPLKSHGKPASFTGDRNGFETSSAATVADLSKQPNVHWSIAASKSNPVTEVDQNGDSTQEGGVEAATRSSLPDASDGNETEEREALEDSADQCATEDEPDGSIFKYRVLNVMSRLQQRRSTNDFLSSRSVEPDDVFQQLDCPDGMSRQSCSCGGSLASVGGVPGQHAADRRQHTATEASPYLLTLLQCVKEDRCDEYDVTADEVHLVIRAWQTGVAAHISMPDHRQNQQNTAAPSPLTSLFGKEKLVEVRLEQLPDAESGLQIAVWGHEKLKCCMLAQATYLTDSILEDWYPGLYQKAYRSVPCPKCVQERLTPSNSDRYVPSQVHNFDLDRLISTATTALYTPQCPHHGSIDMKQLAPDVLLCDLPGDILLEAEDFDDNLKLSEGNKLGDGGFAQVYKAQFHNRQVAVKLFTRKSDSRTLPYRELRAEVSALDQLKHPNVVSMIGACHSPICLVLELAPMGSMSSVLQKIYKTGVPLPMAHLALLQVTNALEYLHSLRIIYRDLKPQNILVWSLDTEKVLVKLADYGIATFALPAGIRDPQGTVGYMAPEVSAKSRIPYTEKADIFSLGVVVFEVVSGRRPYWNKTANFNVFEAQMAGIQVSLDEAVLANAEEGTLISPSVSLAPSTSSASLDSLWSVRSDDIDGVANETRPGARSLLREKRYSSGTDSRLKQRKSRPVRGPSLPAYNVYQPTSTPMRRQTTEKVLGLDQAKMPPPAFRRTLWHNTHNISRAAAAGVATDGEASMTEEKAALCVYMCFQHLVDTCLDPMPQNRPSARQVAAHLALCCCCPRETSLQVKPQSASQKLIMCATAVSCDGLVFTPMADTPPIEFSVSLSPTSSPAKGPLSPFRDSFLASPTGSSMPLGTDMVGGFVQGRQKATHFFPTSPVTPSIKAFQSASPSANWRASQSTCSVDRRQSILQRQDTFNDNNSLLLSLSGGSFHTASQAETPENRQKPIAVTSEPVLCQFACICCNDKVQSYNCFSGNSQVGACKLDGDMITAACCVGHSEIWLGTAGGLVQVHSLPDLKECGRNVVSAAVTCITTVRSNVGMSILPACDVLVGSQDGQLTRFYAQAEKGHAINALPQFIRTISPHDSDGPVTCISHANHRNIFACVVGKRLLLVFDCVLWRERSRSCVDFSEKAVSQICMSDHGLWIFTEESNEVVLLDPDDGSVLTRICTRCEVLLALDVPLSLVTDKLSANPSAKLMSPLYFTVTSITLTANTFWVMLASGILLVFTMDELACPTLTSCRQAHQSGGMLYCMDTCSILSLGMQLQGTSWLTLLKDASDEPVLTSKELVLLQWEVQDAKLE